MPRIFRNTVRTALILQSVLQAWYRRFIVFDIFTLVEGNSIKGSRFPARRGIQPVVPSRAHFNIFEEEFSR